MCFVLIAGANDRRVALFQAALARCGLPAAEAVSYADVFAGGDTLATRLHGVDVVRIESPGKDAEANRLLMAHGAALTGGDVYPEEKGRMFDAAQWYAGFKAAMSHIEAALPSHVRLMAHPRESALMFDKTASRQHLADAGVPVPPYLGAPTGYHDLLAMMRAKDTARVFIKLRYGSSASGAVAYRISGDRHQAVTTVEQADGHLYNTRRLRVLTNQADIAALVDALGRYPLHVERWIPKAGISGRAFDLRVVVIAGRACHTVVRMSDTPMTNLHLLNARSDAEELRRRMSPAAWDAAMATCECALAAFPHSLYAGVDLLIEAGYRRHHVLEVNAFGDLLPNVFHQGVDTYTHEIHAVMRR